MKTTAVMMDLQDFRNAIERALRSGKTGTPVSLRCYCQLADSQADPVEVFLRLLPLAESIFPLKEARLMARRSGEGRQLTVVLNLQKGPVLTFTVGSGAARTDQLNWLLIGNRGIVRLEGGDLFAPVFPEKSVGPEKNDFEKNLWKDSIEKSLKENAAIDLPTPV